LTMTQQKTIKQKGSNPSMGERRSKKFDDYRIYSRIGREILDDLWRYFFQFDLYAGHKFEYQTFYFLTYHLTQYH
jgi:hypothetical protein